MSQGERKGMARGDAVVGKADVGVADAATGDGDENLHGGQFGHGGAVPGEEARGSEFPGADRSGRRAGDGGGHGKVRTFVLMEDDRPLERLGKVTAVTPTGDAPGRRRAPREAAAAAHPTSVAGENVSHP